MERIVIQTALWMDFTAPPLLLSPKLSMARKTEKVIELIYQWRYFSTGEAKAALGSPDREGCGEAAPMLRGRE